MKKIKGPKSLPDDDDVKPPVATLYPSCRLTLAIMCMFATFNMLILRINLSFALVCMVKTNPLQFLGNVTDTNSTGADDDHDVTCQLVSGSQGQRDKYGEGEFEWNKELQGRLLGGFFYGYAITQIFGGWLSDRFGGKSMFIGGMLCVSILTMFNPIAARFSPDCLFAVRVLQGITQGFSLPPIMVLFSRWTGPGERGICLSIAYAGFPLGSALIFPISSFLCQYGFSGGWPSIFYVTGMFGLVWCIATYFLVYDTPEDHPRISLEEKKYLEASNAVHGQSHSKRFTVPWYSIMTSPPVYAVVFTHFFASWGFHTILINLPIFMKEVLYFEVGENGLLSALPYMGTLGVHMLAGHLFDRLRNKKVISLTWLRKIFNTVGLVIPGITMLVMAGLSCHHQYGAIANIAIGQAFTECALMGGYLLSFIDLAPQYSGILIGITNSVGVTTGFATPATVAALTPQRTREEWLYVFYISAGCYFIGALVYLLLGSSELQEWAKDEEKEDEKVGDVEAQPIPPEKELMLVPALNASYTSVE